MKYTWRTYDLVIVVCTLLLLGLGLCCIYSAVADKVGGTGVGDEFGRQLLMALVGLGLFVGCAHIDTKVWFKSAPALYAVLILLLVGVLALGSEAKGAQRWIAVGSWHMQPSEPAKLLLIIAVSRFLAGARNFPNAQLQPTFKRFVMVLGVIALPALLVMKQPDLGTAIVTAVVGFSLLFISGFNWVWIFAVIGSGLAALPYVLHDYQRERIMVFMDPEADPMGAGWNIIQSKIAVGSGGWWGHGFMQGTQNRLNFVPENHTDFIFTIVGEEMGFVGVCCLLLILAVLVARALQIARMSSTPFECYVATGIAVSLAVHAVVNIGMTIGVFPVVGLPLPLVSYGGSAVLTNLASLGILTHISSRCARLPV